MAKSCADKEGRQKNTWIDFIIQKGFKTENFGHDYKFYVWPTVHLDTV